MNKNKQRTISIIYFFNMATLVEIKCLGDEKYNSYKELEELRRKLEVLSREIKKNTTKILTSCHGLQVS